MRRVAVLGLGLGLSLASPAGAVRAPPGADSPGLGAPAPTCGVPQPSFGVIIDDGAIAAGQLNGIYVDGVVPIPVRLGLNLAPVSTLQQVIDSGALVVDVVGPEGPLASAELDVVPAPPTAGVAAAGQAAWLIWTGVDVFAPDTSYEVHYTFANDKLVPCPEALPRAGIIPFSTGSFSVVDKLEPVETFGTTLEPQVIPGPGCCEAPHRTECLSEGNCVACWSSYTEAARGTASATTTLPLSYFKIELGMLAGDRHQPLVQTFGFPAASTFAIVDRAPEYCFVVGVRPRGNVDEVATSMRCVASNAYPPSAATPPLVAMPVGECAEDPFAGTGDGGATLHVAFGASEDEAKAKAKPPAPALGTPPAIPGMSPTTSSGNGGPSSASPGGCTVSGTPTPASTGAAFACLGLGLLLFSARARDRRTRGPRSS